MQPEEAIHPDFSHLGNDFPGAVGQKSINHDSIKSGERTHLARGVSMKSIERGLRIQPRNHGPYQRSRVPTAVESGRLALQDDEIARMMNGDIELRPPFHEGDAIHAFDTPTQRETQHAISNVVQGLAINPGIKSLSERCAGVDA